MALAEDILADNNSICHGPFAVSQGQAIPSVQDIALGANEGRRLNLVALFVDIRHSTKLVQVLGLVRAARMYKAYLRGVTKTIRARGGELLSFNGDGVAAGFVGDTAATAACLTGLNLNWFLAHVLKPEVDATLRQLQAPDGLWFDFGIGIDLGDVLVVRGGIRGNDNSDLVWAGNPLNQAVKLSGLGFMLIRCTFLMAYLARCTTASLSTAVSRFGNGSTAMKSINSCGALTGGLGRTTCKPSLVP